MNSTQTQNRATSQDYLRQMAPHRTEEELQFSLGYYTQNVPGVIAGEIQPLSDEEAEEIQKQSQEEVMTSEVEPEAEAEAEEPQPQKKKRGRPKKTTETQS